VRHESKDSISGRPTSSVYSQPSPLHTTFAPQNQNQRDPPNVVRHHQPDAFDDDVSPPSSPELLSPGNVYVLAPLPFRADQIFSRRGGTRLRDNLRIALPPHVGSPSPLPGRRRRHWLRIGGGLRLVFSVSRPGHGPWAATHSPTPVASSPLRPVINLSFALVYVSANIACAH
jgi:hypothetical protein